MDGGLIESLRKDLLHSDGSKDGIAGNLFPLGEQVVQDRKAYRIRFGPANKNDIDWADEALIDARPPPVQIYSTGRSLSGGPALNRDQIERLPRRFEHCDVAMIPLLPRQPRAASFVLRGSVQNPNCLVLRPRPPDTGPQIRLTRIR